MGAQPQGSAVPHVAAPRFASKPLQTSDTHANPNANANASGHSHSHGPHCSHNHSPPVASAAPQLPPQEELSPLDELFHSAKTNNLQRFRDILTEHSQPAPMPASETPPPPPMTAAEMVQQRDAQGHTLAHWIAQRGSSEFLEYAASMGAPLDLPSDDNVRLHAIHWACSTGNLAVLKTFVRLGVDINTADVTKHRTPLLIAAQNGFPLLVMYCVKHGADVTLVDIDEDSAIHWAAYKGATEIVSVFQYLGLSTDKQDRYGQTPLHLAAMRGEFATVQYLVEELESDLHVLDAHGRTPYQLAKSKGFHQVASYLARRQFRAKWNVFSWWESSRTPYYFVLANLPVAFVVYLRYIIPYMPELRALYVLHLLWNVVTWSLFFLTTRTIPGNLAKVATYQREYSTVTEALVTEGGHPSTNLCLLERPLCHSCHIQRPLRAKHCRVCKHCVDTFDHHCPFVDNCIGRTNYVYFMGFVGALLLDILLLEYILYVQWRTHGAVWWLVLAMLYGAVLLVPVGHLFGFHLYLTTKNLTTNEVVNAHRYQYLRGADGTYRNPFDRGVVTNCADRCLPVHTSDRDAAQSPDYDQDYDQERRGFLHKNEHGDYEHDVAALSV